MNVFELLLVDLVLMAISVIILMEVGITVDIWLIIFVGIIFLSPFIVYAIIKMVLKLSRGRKIIGKVDIDELKYRFAKYLLKEYNFDIFVPNHIFGDKGKKSKYKYPIKIHRCYPAEIEKWCLEIPDIISDPHVFDGFETKILLYFNKSGEVDDDRTMNDKFGWDEDLLRLPLNLYLRQPPKTEKAEKLLERILREREEIPEEIIERAIRKELKTVTVPTE